jgi:DNA-binding NarL/FixJ family response regulator
LMGIDVEKLFVIVLIVFLCTQDRNDVLVVGFQAHLPKPVKAEALVSAVATLTRRK